MRIKDAIEPGAAAAVSAFPRLEDYLERLPTVAAGGQRLWLDPQGRAQGRYFNCTLTSVFQPVRLLDSERIVGYEAFVRTSSDRDSGLSLWKLLERAASDDESVELDRLCRILHVINFYRQPQAAGQDLYLNVHGRLLAAVGSGHGLVFRRILDGLGLPAERIVLQMPVVRPKQGWLLHYVTDNYRRNGFRVAFSTEQAADGLQLLDSARPDAIKLDARQIADPAALAALLERCRKSGVELLFKRIEQAQVVATLRRMAHPEQPLRVQGHAWDIPAGLLRPNAVGAYPA